MKPRAIELASELDLGGVGEEVANGVKMRGVM